MFTKWECCRISRHGSSCGRADYFCTLIVLALDAPLMILTYKGVCMSSGQDPQKLYFHAIPCTYLQQASMSSRCLYLPVIPLSQYLYQ
eukprot:scaffold22157_cov19-Tisochrysis_lutea.AAC.1